MSTESTKSTQTTRRPSEESCNRWKDYPLPGTVYFTPGKDYSFYRRVLDQDPTQRFESDVIDIEVLRVAGMLGGSVDDSEARINSDNICRRITNQQELDVELLCPKAQGEQVFYLIPQIFSWGELQITRDAFQQLLSAERVFAPFLNIVAEFGTKTRDTHPKRHMFHRYHYSPASSLARRDGPLYHDHEIAYLLQYVEENGRNHGDPWSLRQTGIYQQFDVASKRSTWILLQLKGSTRRSLEETLQTETGPIGTVQDSLHPHAALLLATSENWGEYINHLQGRLRDIDEKASFSKVGIDAVHDYSVQFSDMQALQRLRRKLIEISSILTSCLDMAARLEAHCCAVGDPVLKDNQVVMSINMYVTNIRVCQQNLAMTMQSLEGTFELLSKVVEFRNVESLKAVNTATERSASSLMTAVSLIHRETRTAVALTAQSHQDAKTIKALAAVSTIFLPASLIATIFSSVLVQVRQESTQGTHFVLATQFWIYVLASIILTLITIGGTQLLERRWLRTISLPAIGHP